MLLQWENSMQLHQTCNPSLQKSNESSKINPLLQGLSSSLFKDANLMLEDGDDPCIFLLSLSRRSPDASA